MIYLVVAAVYVFGGWATAAACFADLESIYPNYGANLAWAVSYGAFPPFWISILIVTGFYRSDFDWRFRGAGRPGEAKG